MIKLLLTGSSGMVGSRFVELHSTKFHLLTPSSSDLDITDKNKVLDYISKEKPEVIVNFAAYTNVGEAENDRGNKNGDCWRINAKAVENLVSVASDQGIFLIQISTDMVFSGSKDFPGPYSEEQIPLEEEDKLTWYGYSKAEGERIILNGLKDNSAILRIIYPVRAKFDAKLDYLRKPLSMFDQGKLYPMFGDQQVSISFIDEVALALLKIIEKKIPGVFHASSRDLSTPHKLVSYLLYKARGVKDAVTESSLDEFLESQNLSSVRYPKFGGLKVEKTEEVLGIKFSSAQEIIDQLAEQGV